MANKVYCADDVKIREEYKRLVEKYYLKTLYQNLNFEDNKNASKVSYYGKLRPLLKNEYKNLV